MACRSNMWVHVCTAGKAVGAVKGGMQAKGGVQAKAGMDKENEVEQGQARKAFVQKPLLQPPKALNERCVL